MGGSVYFNQSAAQWDGPRKCHSALMEIKLYRQSNERGIGTYGNKVNGSSAEIDTSVPYYDF